MANLEAKRQRQLESDKKKLLKQDTLRARDLESSAEKMAQPNTVVEQVDYAERTRQFEKEMAEKTANLEGMADRNDPRPMSKDDYIMYDMNFRKLADFIGIPTGELSKYGEELSLLLDWAMTTSKSDDILDNLLQIKDLKKSIGFQEVGPTMLKKLYQYIRLDLDGQRLEEPDLVEIKKEKELLKE
jgi:tricorn protease-like protein